jgi:hypothetical protein
MNVLFPRGTFFLAYRITSISIHFTDYTMKTLENAQCEEATASVCNTLLSLTSGTVRRTGAATSPTRTCCRCYNRMLQLYLLSSAYLLSISNLGYFTNPRSITTSAKIGTLLEFTRA